MHYLDALLIVRNERPQYLTEWAEHYFKLGVEHIHIIEHTPSNTKIPQLPHTTITRIASERARQDEAYFELIPTIQSEWLAIIDADEFIICNDLHTLLQNTKADALAINWLVFGSSGHIEPIYPIHGNYTYRAATNHIINTHVKSIVRPAAIHHQGQNPHYFGIKTVNELGQPVTSPFSPYTGTKIRINHYYTRSRQDWEARMTRGQADQPDKKRPFRTWSDFIEIERDCTVCDPHPTYI